jgi:TonB family protein
VSGTRVTWVTLVIFIACATVSGVAALGQDHGSASVGPEQAGQQPQALMVSGVPPEYPKKARKKQIQGAVLLKILISPQGDVRDVTVESGDSLLASAATNAVKQWKYRPYLMRGRPVELESYVRVNFTLPGN